MFQLPSTTQRTAIVGRTGSGKSQFGLWLLSCAPFDRMPYIIFDYKNEDMIGEIEHAEELKLGELPSEAGLYVVRPAPGQEEEVEDYLWAIWEKENTGVFVDECYMIDKNSRAFKACLTQGRSKHIPMYLLSQRPVDVSRFVFSESDNHAVFHLNDRRDRETVEKYTPIDKDAPMLPEFHSRWYQVSKHEKYHLLPAPPRANIIERFYDRLKPAKPRRIFV